MGPNPQVFSQDLTWLFLFSRSYPQNFLSKFDVSMIYHQLNVFLQDFSNSFHCWFNFYILLYSGASIILGGVSRCHSHLLKTEEEFLFNLAPFSSRFMVLACCHPLIIIFDCENPFHPSGDIQGYFQFDYPEPIISEDLFILSFQLSFPKSHRCIIQYSLISAWSLRFSCI